MGENRRRALLMRVLSSIILIPIVIAAVTYGGTAFVLLIAFMMAAMLYEWSRMVEGVAFTQGFWMLAAIAAAAIISAAFGAFVIAYVIVLAGGAGVLSLTYRRVQYWLAAAAIYIIAPTLSLAWLRISAPDGMAFTVLLFAIVWSADIGAFIFGKLIGGPIISSALSPSKTWAGIGGGIGGGIGAGMTIAPMFFTADAALAGAFLGGGLGAASVIGDLAESAIKRHFGIKDISSFIPGHGGVLDRLDGMIFATAAMTSVYFLFMVAAGVVV